MVSQSLHVSVGKVLVQETGCSSYDTGKISLHFFICEEENISLISPPPISENVGEKRTVVPGNIINKRIKEYFESSCILLLKISSPNINLYTSETTQYSPVIIVGDHNISGISCNIDHFWFLLAHLFRKHLNMKMSF